MSSNRRIEEADENYNATVNVSEKDGRGSTWNEWKGGIMERKAPQRGRKPLFSPKPKKNPRIKSRVGTSQSSKERHQEAERREEPKKGMA
jgi:hypothetical protein